MKSTKERNVCGLYFERMDTCTSVSVRSLEIILLCCYSAPVFSFRLNSLILTLTEATAEKVSRVWSNKFLFRAVAEKNDASPC